MLKQKILELKQIIISQSNYVEKMLHRCIDGFINNKSDELKKVIDVNEKEIHKNEMIIDELYTNILALYQAEAKDLRTVLMIIKMNIDLERIADQCVNIAESSMFLIGRNGFKMLNDLSKMAEFVEKMFRTTINAFVNEDVDAAQKICADDQIIDDLNEKIIKDMMAYMACEAKAIESSFHLIRISHNFEKIADLATNIAEETVYIAAGIDIKHQHFE